MQPRVLFVRSDVKLAGPGKLMLASALALRDAGAEVIIASSGGAMVAEIEAAGIRHVTLPDLQIGRRTLPGSIKTSWQLLRIVRRERIDVVHTYNALAGLVSLPACVLGRARLFNTVLGYGREKLLKYAPFRLIAVSRFVSRQLQEAGVPASKIQVVYNSTLDERYLLSDRQAFDALQEQRKRISPFTFVSVAMFAAHKGHAEILDATAAYRQRDGTNPIRVILIGDGPSRKEQQARAEVLGVSDIVHFEGASDKVAEHMNRAHAFIHLAAFETFGIVIAEASARGLPVVASDVGGIPEVMDNGKTGILVNQENSHEVADAMILLTSDPVICGEYGWAGAQRARDKFSRQQMARDLLSLYQGAGTY